MSTNDKKIAYGHTRKVSRLPPLPKTLAAAQQENFDKVLNRGGQILNLHRVSAHAPALARVRGDFVWALRESCAATRKMRELAIVRVAYLTDCEYELHHHLPLARRAGLTDAQVAALRDWRGSEALFDAAQCALLAYLDTMFLNNGDVDDATFQGMAAHFSPQEIVELSVCATYYFANAYFVNALRLEIDEPGTTSAPGSF